MTKDPSDNVYWVGLGFLPVEVGYVPNAKVWDAALKRLEIGPEPFPISDARCVWWDRAAGRQNNIILITIGASSRGYSVSQVAGLVAHECMHAWRHIREIMGEKTPSLEFEAYALQRLVQDVMFAHQTKRRTPWKAGK